MVTFTSTCVSYAFINIVLFLVQLVDTSLLSQKKQLSILYIEFVCGKHLNLTVIVTVRCCNYCKLSDCVTKFLFSQNDVKD